MKKHFAVFTGIAMLVVAVIVVSREVGPWRGNIISTDPNANCSLQGIDCVGTCPNGQACGVSTTGNSFCGCGPISSARASQNNSASSYGSTSSSYPVCPQKHTAPVQMTVITSGRTRAIARNLVPTAIAEKCKPNLGTLSCAPPDGCIDVPGSVKAVFKNTISDPSNYDCDATPTNGVFTCRVHGTCTTYVDCFRDPRLPS